ncbi:MAG: KAP family NTPase, partial [Pararheinheimera sp.]|nr:KAP family NTPase [Rheinheimera sp.]
MFIPEGPIDDVEEDILGRKSFSVHLSGALKSWTEKDSLVIAVYGEWGSGKTSLVNMATGIIQKTTEGPEKPSIVRFNPWAYSESRDILTSFISEVVKHIKKDKRPSKRLIRNLEYYLGMISIAPTPTEQRSGLDAIITILALLGISFGQIVANSTIALSALMTWAGVAGLGYLLVNATIKKYLSFLKLSEAYHTRTVDEVKSEICSELSTRSKKLIVIIDDIDRLTTEEMRSVFRIIRTNADFPNTIYLLSFDRSVVEKSLSVQAGVSGRDYLEKIVQVSFDVPRISEDKVTNYLLKELDEVLQNLPESAARFFSKSEVHWANVFNSGFRYYFTNLRDVKRYIGSVGFNISQMFIGSEMEINPIDFFGIELIRIFEPEFYRFILNNKGLFTSTNDDGASREEKKKVVLENLSQAGSPNNLRELVFTLFPQVKGFADGFGNTSYASGWQSTWTKDLRICTQRFFNAYFNYIPAGDETEL